MPPRPPAPRAPSPTAPSAGPPPSATSIPRTPARSRWPAASAAPRTRAPSPPTPATSSSAIPPRRRAMTVAPRIETDRLVLRPHRMEDFAAMAAFYASDAASFVGGPMPAPRAWHRFAADVGGWDLLGFGAWAIEEKATGAFAGQLALSKPPHFPEREIGWLLMPGFEGQRLRRRGRARRTRLRLRHPRLAHRRQLRQSRQRPLDRARPPPRLHRGRRRRAALPLGHRLPPPEPRRRCQ